MLVVLLAFALDPRDSLDLITLPCNVSGTLGLPFWAWSSRGIQSPARTFVKRSTECQLRNHRAHTPTPSSSHTSVSVSQPPLSPLTHNVKVKTRTLQCLEVCG